MITIKKDLSSFELAGNLPSILSSSSIYSITNLKALKKQAEEFGLETQYCFNSLCLAVYDITQLEHFANQSDLEEFTINFDENKYCYAPITLVIKYEDITVKNELNRQDYLKEVYFCYNLIFSFGRREYTNKIFPVGCNIYRQNVQYRHIVKSYMHSHATGFNYTLPRKSSYMYNAEFQEDQLCYGTSEFKYKLVGCFEELPLYFQPANVIHYTQLFLSTESLDGVPYKYLRNNWKFNYYEETKKDVLDYKNAYLRIAKEILKNIENPDLYLQIDSSGSVRCHNSPFLVQIVKDYNYHYLLNERSQTGRYELKCGDSTPHYDVRDGYFELTTANCSSHFVWRGEFLKIKPYQDDAERSPGEQGLSQRHLIYINENLDNIIKSKLKLHEIYR